jgi:nucleoside-diphosphate-sugar epimerase
VAANAGHQIVGQYRRGDNRHSVSSIDKLRQLGWSPRRSLDDIFDDFLGWIDSIGGVPDYIPDAYGAMRGAGVVVTVH